MNGIDYKIRHNVLSDMHRPVKIGIFIPGRLSSERLPNKLILPLNDNGDTLWSIACNKLNNLPDEFVKVALCQDDELVKVADKHKNIKVVRRDYNTSIAEGPMNYIFKDLEGVEGVTHWMFLNPCLAFLKEETICKVLRQFVMNPFKFATSAKEYKNWLFNDEAEIQTSIDYDTLSTKDIKGLYEAAHAFHIFKKDFLFGEYKNMLMVSDKPALFVIPKEECIDVDDSTDYEYVKYLMS